MTDHLPECSVRTYTTDDGMVYEVAGDLCICPALRACEQRVRHERPWMADWTAGNKQGWSDALDAAREAVEKASSLLHPLGPALAAIDALKEKP